MNDGIDKVEKKGENEIKEENEEEIRDSTVRRQDVRKWKIAEYQGRSLVRLTSGREDQDKDPSTHCPSF